MDSREQTYGAIRKLLATLGDPYTRFLDPDAAAALAGANSGAVTGVGLELAPVARPGAAAGEGPELVRGRGGGQVVWVVWGAEGWAATDMY